MLPSPILYLHYNNPVKVNWAEKKSKIQGCLVNFIIQPERLQSLPDVF